MIEPARRLFALLSIALVAMIIGTAPPNDAKAQGLFDHPKYAAIVVDAHSGEVLYARRADALRYPASITKVMTLYLTFEALQTGRLSLNDEIVVSPHAAAQSPTKLGIRAGGTVKVDDAIRSIALLSANDIAVAMAERIGGSESRFAALMTLRAQELGMTNSRFVNANGLPDSRQVTTARDIAILSRAVMRDYPQYYSYFGQQSFNFRGRTINNHNHLLKKMPGVDGIKTGYTNAAGYNLAASQVKDGRRLITVVLGGSSNAARDENVADLLDAGFDVLAKRKLGQNITIAANISEPEDISGAGVRPQLEQGSAEQAGVHIVLADNQAPLKGLQPLASADSNPGSRILSAAVAETSPVEATRVRPSTLKQNVALAANDCTPVRVKVKAPAKRGRHGRHAKAKFTTVTRCAPAKDVQVASADVNCTKVRKGRHHRKVACAPAEKTAAVAKTEVAKVECVKTKKHRRHHKAAACETATTEVAAKGKAKADAKQDVADASDSVAGRYLIQVGAFKSQGEAQRRLTQISQRYGSVVSSASTQVQSASGNYRARFRGFSAAQAKAACHTLTSKGERCLVLSKG